MIVLCFITVFNCFADTQNDSCLGHIEKIIDNPNEFIPKNRNEQKIKTLLTQTSKYNLDKKEEALILRKLFSMKELPNYRLLKAYFLYLNSLKPIEKKEGIIQMDYLLKPDLSKSRILKRFFRINKKVRKRNQRKIERLSEKLMKEDDQLDERQAYDKALGKIGPKLRQYEELSYACRGTRKTPFTDQAEKELKKFTFWIVTGSSLGSYTWANHEKWEGWDDYEFYLRFTYEWLFQLSTSMIGVSNLSNPNYSLARKTLFKYGWARTNGAADGAAYDFLFGTSGVAHNQNIEWLIGNAKAYLTGTTPPHRPDQRQQAIDEILNSGNRDQRLAELQKQLESPRYWQTMVKFWGDQWGSLKGHLGFESEDKLKDVDLTELSDDDFNREEIQSLIFMAAAQEAYEETKGEMGLIQTGNRGFDRWTFQSAYGAALLPRDMAVALYVKHLLCMGQYDKKAAYMKALALFLANRFLGDPLYYKSREMMINQ